MRLDAVDWLNKGWRYFFSCVFYFKVQIFTIFANIISELFALDFASRSQTITPSTASTTFRYRIFYFTNKLTLLCVKKYFSNHRYLMISINKNANSWKYFLHTIIISWCSRKWHWNAMDSLIQFIVDVSILFYFKDINKKISFLSLLNIWLSKLDKIPISSRI